MNGLDLGSLFSNGCSHEDPLPVRKCDSSARNEQTVLDEYSRPTAFTLEQWIQTKATTPRLVIPSEAEESYSLVFATAFQAVTALRGNHEPQARDLHLVGIRTDLCDPSPLFQGPSQSTRRFCMCAKLGSWNTKCRSRSAVTVWNAGRNEKVRVLGSARNDKPKGEWLLLLTLVSVQEQQVPPLSAPCGARRWDDNFFELNTFPDDQTVFFCLYLHTSESNARNDKGERGYCYRHWLSVQKTRFLGCAPNEQTVFRKSNHR